MNLRQCLRWWRAAPKCRPPRAATPDWVTAGGAAPEPAAPEPPWGCGWFDSSDELHCGLLVTEHLSPERVANEVPLGWWLDWQAGRPQAAVQGLAERLGRVG